MDEERKGAKKRREESLTIPPAQPSSSTMLDTDSMDVDNSNGKSPPSASGKKSMITSFFKPKTPFETTPDGSHQPKPTLNSVSDEDVKHGDCPQLGSSAVEKRDCLQKRDDGRRSRKCNSVSKDGLEQKKAIKIANSLDCHDRNDKLKISSKKVLKDKLQSAQQLCADRKQEGSSKSKHELSKRGKMTNGLEKDPKSSLGQEKKHSKKRKKIAELDSSSEDFEKDKRTKIPKNEPLESDLLQEHTVDENPQLAAAVNHDVSGYCSNDDIFKVNENSDNVKEISFEDFLNESMEQNEENTSTKVEAQDENKGGQSTDTKVLGTGVFNEMESASPSQKGTKSSGQTANASIFRNYRKASKQNSTKTADQSCTEKISDGTRHEQPSNSQTKSEQNPASCPVDDDSVLTISFSEFLQENATSNKQETSQLSRPKQKLLTIKAEVHTQPTADSSVIDLCRSPESEKSVSTTKRTSNVVVDLTDLDLTIVNTDQAVSVSDMKNSKAVYSIFQKGPKDKSKESDSKSLRKSEQTKPAKVSLGGKSKRGQQRKPKVADTSPELIYERSPQTDDMKRGQLKTKNKKNIGKSRKKIFGAKSEGENTEEEFENNNGTTKRGRKIKKLGNITSLERAENKQSEIVMTSTPKAKHAKNMTAQKLLQRAKSRHMSQASRASRQVDDSKPVIHRTKTAPETAKRSVKHTSHDQDSESKNLRRPQRDLNRVLGRKPQAKEGVSGDKMETNIRAAATKKKRAVVEDVQARKATKLAPMFTKEGRLALAKKQRMSETTDNDSACMMIVSDDDEASRDSIRSDWGGTKSGCDVFVRTRESDAEWSYPPFPTISHVLQIAPETEGNLDWWQLPRLSSFGKFPVKHQHSGASYSENFISRDRLIRMGDFTLCLGDEDKAIMTKQFTCHPELSYDIQRLILDRIKTANPRFPVNRVFKRYLAKRKGEPVLPKIRQGETPSERQCIPTEDSAFTKLKGDRPSSAKRKSETTDLKTTKRRRVTSQEGSAETEVQNRVSLRRRSSRGAVKDQEDEEKQVVKQPRRSSRQLEKATTQEGNPKEAKETRSLRSRKAKKPATESKGSGVGIAKATETQADKLASLAWTDKYQPTASAEVIGNAQAMKRLVGWLTEWKKKTVRIKKKMKKQRGKRGNKTTLEVPVEDSDSDFAFDSDGSSSNSEDEDDTLSNAMLIVGPTGCGKTAAVYACAKELGFKIFEVNASSKRTGKQILADLGEATQSHHLSTHQRDNCNSALGSFLHAKSPPGARVVKPEAKKTPVPKAFAAFYKAGADAAKHHGKKTKAPVKKTQKKSQPGDPAPKAPRTSQPHPQPNTVHGSSNDGVATQRLTSTSLILFEDVDVVFDEDKGFLSAVSTFLKTTKRPIVLTTSDERFAEIFEERYESAVFRKPPTSLLATHLQLLCLAENVYASHPDLQRVVSLLDHDIRRCWLAAQFWVNSGAGKFSPIPPKPPSSKDDMTLLEAQTKGQNTTLSCSNDSKATRSVDDKELGSLPAIQSGFFENVTGLCNLTRVGKDVFSALKVRSNVSCLRDKSVIVETLQRENTTYVFFRNIQELLPMAPCQLHRHTSVKSGPNRSRTESKPSVTGSRPQLLNRALLAQMATFADDISSLDSCTFSPVHDGKGLGTQGWWCAQVKPTLAIELPSRDNRDFARHATGRAIGGFVEAASFERCHKNWGRTVERFRISHGTTGGDACQTDSKTEESRSDKDTVAVHVKSTNDPAGCFKFGESSLTKCPDLYPVLAEKLSLFTYCNHRAIALDYLPMLRCVCRSEQFREETKIKRRFLHYLDSISLNLKKPDQVALCSIMDVR